MTILPNYPDKHKMKCPLKVRQKLLGGTSFFYILPMPAIQKASRQSPSPEKQILQGYTNVSASQYALPYQLGHCV